MLHLKNLLYKVLFIYLQVPDPVTTYIIACWSIVNSFMQSLKNRTFSRHTLTIHEEVNTIPSREKYVAIYVDKVSMN